MYVCMDWAVRGTDLAHEPILESAQEYQDKDFRDEVRLSRHNPSSPPTDLGPMMLQT